jgi:hypothetical protein
VFLTLVFQNTLSLCSLPSYFKIPSVCVPSLVFQNTLSLCSLLWYFKISSVCVPYPGISKYPQSVFLTLVFQNTLSLCSLPWYFKIPSVCVPCHGISKYPQSVFLVLEFQNKYFYLSQAAKRPKRASTQCRSLNMRSALTSTSASLIRRVQYVGTRTDTAAQVSSPAFISKCGINTTKTS